MFDMVKIRTRQDLPRLNYLDLVHPWLYVLLDREDTQLGAFVEAKEAGDADPSLPDIDD